MEYKYLQQLLKVLTWNPGLLCLPDLFIWQRDKHKIFCI